MRGSPVGSADWSVAKGAIVTAYLNAHIADAQEAAKYVDEELTGSFASRRYDFDLAEARATTRDFPIALHQGRQVKDYNMKGSVWIAKDTGVMVRFDLETAMVFLNGEEYTTHYAGRVTKNEHSSASTEK